MKETTFSLESMVSGLMELEPRGLLELGSLLNHDCSTTVARKIENLSTCMLHERHFKSPILFKVHFQATRHQLCTTLANVFGQDEIFAALEGVK